MGHEHFKKFIHPKNNAAIKEQFKQEKKRAKRERAEAINRHFEERRALHNAGYSANSATLQPDARKKYPAVKETGSKPTVPASLQKKPTGYSVQMPLNKYVAHCGISGRRDAAQLVKDGKITVNGAVVTEPGFKVNGSEIIMYNGKQLFVTQKLVYILLNKPKDYITTTDDPQGRKTVLQLIKQATPERIYPVGRLDRNTSGVLLFTNDGQLTQMLTHPAYNIKKVYEAKLNKPLTRAHFDKILKGVRLEDGEIHADALAYADNRDKSVVGIEIHSGRNRIVRRIFEYLGYEVKALDRVMYANLTKKNVERGRWRYLSEKEVRLLKFMNAAASRPPKKKENEPA